MAVLSKLNISSLRRLYLTLPTTTYDSNHVKLICNHLTSKVSKPEADFDTMLDPIVNALKDQFKSSGLDWAAHGVRWGTFFLNLCVNVISAITTNKPWVRAMNILCIISIIVAVILEILSTVKNYSKAETLEQDLTKIVRKALVSAFLDGGEDTMFGDLFNTPPSTPISSSPSKIPTLIQPVPSTSATPVSVAGASKATVTMEKAVDVVVKGVTITPETQSIMKSTPPLRPGGTHKNMTFSSSQKLVRKEAAHWYTIVKKCMSLTLVLVAFGVTRGDITAMSAWITMDKFKDVIVKNYETANDVLEWLAIDICGFEFTEKIDALKSITKQLQEAEDFLATAKEEFAEKPELILNLTQHITRSTKLIQTAGSIKDLAIKNSVDILKVRQTALVSEMDDILKTVQMKSTRQEPIPIMIYGEPGSGKTTYIKNCLIPAIARELKLPNSTYTVKFTQTDKYWPEYANQHFAFFDEAFDRASDQSDPMVETFNTVCSATPYNMQGAFNKYQMCNFKFVFVITNKLTCPNLSHTLTPEASCGFWHRFGPLIRYDVTPAHKSTTGQRGSHKWKDDWAHVALAESSTVINPSAGTYTVNQLHSVTHNALVKRCVDAYYKQQQNFIAAKMAVRQESDDTSAFVVNISGPTGVGKSFSARFIAGKCARFRNLKVVEHQNRLSAITPGVHIANDFLPYNESDYNTLYNLLPNQLIFSTNNISLVQTWPSYLRWLINPLLTLTSVLPYSQYFPKNVEYGIIDKPKEIGTTRRMGVPGMHSTPTGKVKVMSTEAISFVQTKRGFLYEPSTKKTYDLTAASTHVWQSYCTYMESHGEILMAYGQIPAITPDIDIHFSSRERCLSTLRSRISTLAALASPNVDRGIIIPDPRKTFGDLIIDEDYFMLPSATDIEPDTIVRTMVSTLRHLGVTGSARVKIGFTTYTAIGNTLTCSYMADMPDLTITGDIVEIKVRNELVVVSTVDDLIRGFRNGFKGYSATQLEYILLFKTEIETSTAGAIVVNRYEELEMVKQLSIEAAEHKMSLTQMMRNHPTFPYLVALTVVMGSAVIVGLVAIITRFCSSSVDDEVNTHVAQESFPDEVTERAFEEHAKKRELDQEQIQSLRRMRLSQDRALDQPIGDMEYNAFIHYNNLAVQESVGNLVPSAAMNHLVKKIHKNTVVCVVGDKATTAHGILLLNDLVLTVSHMGHVDPRVVSDFGTTVKTWPAQLVVDIPERDLQIWRITDKTFPPAQNIMKYFPKTDMPTTAHAQLCVLSSTNYNVSCTLTPDPIVKYENWDWVKGGYVANFHSSKGAVTKVGYCGFVYLSYDLNTIYGIHVGSKGNGVYGLMTIVSQSILNAVLSSDEAIPESCSPDLPSTTSTIDVMQLSENEQWAVLPCSYHDLWEPKVFSKHALPDSNSLKYVAKVPYNSPYPRRQKFKRTSFPESPDLPNTCAPTPLVMTDDMDLIKDVCGRRDIALTQVAKFGGSIYAADREILKLAKTMVSSYVGEVCQEDMIGGTFPAATMLEAINGFASDHPLYSFSETLNMHSGAGFYWKHHYHIGLKGAFFYQKEDLTYDFRPNEVTRHLQQCIVEAEKAIMEGVPPLFVNEDCIKSELLPKEKVKIGKTRLFSVADTVEVLLERKYFLYPLAIFNKYHNKLPAKIGTNPVRDFDEWAKGMRRFGNTMVESDFVRMDKNLPFDFVLAACCILLQDYNTAYCFARVITCGFHHIYDFIYHRYKGQNSGSGVTSLINTLVVMVLVAYAYIKTYKERTGRLPKGNIFDIMYWLIYSDDLNWIDSRNLSIHDLARVAAEVGMSMTYHVRPINECYFLSRRFHFVDGTVYAALKESSYIRHLYWTSNDIPEQRAIELSLVLDEAAAHTKEHFTAVLHTIFAGLQVTNDVLTLNLMDWRCFTARRTALRHLIYTNKCFTRDPLSVGDAFQQFPTPEQFNSFVKRRYTRVDKIQQTQATTAIFPIEEKFPLATSTVTEFLKVRKEANMSQDQQASQQVSPGAMDKVKAEVVPPATMAKASIADAGGNVSEIPAAPAPAVAITGAIDDTPPLIIGNSLAAPALLEAGGIMNNVYTAAYSSWYLVSQGTVAVDAAHNTVVFQLPYGLESLAGASKLWVSMHKRYTGSINYMIETVGSSALTGTIMVGWTPNLAEQSTIEDLMRIGKWINMPMNASTTGMFTVPDVRKDAFYRDVSENINHGIVGLIHVPLTNPFGTTGATVTYNQYVRLGADFSAVYWQEIPAQIATAYPMIRMSDLVGPGVRWLIDGFETGKAYQGDIFLPGTFITCRASNDPIGLGAHAHADSVAGPVKLLLIIGSDAPQADWSPLQETHLSNVPFNLTSTTLKGIATAHTADGAVPFLDDNFLAHSDTAPALVPFDYQFTSWSSFWNNTTYGHYFYYEETAESNIDVNAATFSVQTDGNYIVDNTDIFQEPDLQVTTWAYPFTSALPADYIHVTLGTHTYPLVGELATTAQGRASVPPTLCATRVIAALKQFAGSRTIEFDVISEYGGAAVLTCRFDTVNGIYCRMQIPRETAYYYQNAVADNMFINNIRIVENATIMRQSPLIFFAARFSNIFSPVLRAQKKKVRLTLQERFEDFNPFVSRRKIAITPRQEAEAAIIAASTIGGAFSSAAAAGGSMFSKKKDREFAKEMMEDQQAWASDMWGKQVRVDTAWKTMGMGYDWKKTNANWAHQSAMAQAAFKHQNAHDFGMWGLNTLNQGMGFAHDNRRQAAAQAHQTAMQQAGFTHSDASQSAQFAHEDSSQSAMFAHEASMQTTDFEHQQALQQQRIDARTGAARAAFGMTNPAMQTVSPSSVTSQPSYGTSNAYAPASHSRPTGYPR